MNSAECWAHLCNQTNIQVVMNVTLSSLEQFKKTLTFKMRLSSAKKSIGKWLFVWTRIENNFKILHKFIVCKYPRFQKGLGQLTDSLSDVVESRFAVFLKFVFGKTVSLLSSQAETFPKQWLARLDLCRALESRHCFSPASRRLELAPSPKKQLTNFKNYEPYITKNAFKKSELAGLTSHFENEISAKTLHIRVYHSEINWSNLG